MIKRTIDLTKEEAVRFIKEGRFTVGMQMRDGVGEVLNDAFNTYLEMFSSEDEADKNENLPKVPAGPYYIDEYIGEVVAPVLVSDEIGCFFIICCDDPAYFDHVTRYCNYMNEKKYPIWLPNAKEVVAYLKEKFDI